MLNVDLSGFMGFNGCWWSLLFCMVLRYVFIRIFMCRGFGKCNVRGVFVYCDFWLIRLWKLFCLFMVVWFCLFL